MSENEYFVTRSELLKARNKEKQQFLPKEGSYLRHSSGVVYKVVYSNVGQMRFTAEIDGIADLTKLTPSPGFADVVPEEMTTA